MRQTWEIYRATLAGDPYAFRAGTQEYVLRSSAGGATNATLRWDQALLSDLAGLREDPRDAELRQRIGETLRRFIAEADSPEYEAALQTAAERGEPITLTLRLAAAELFALPWELLTVKSSGQHVGELPGTLLRYAWPETATKPAAPSALAGAGRILFAWSASHGPVPASQHQHALEQACRRGHLPFDRNQDVLSHASPRRLDQTLRDATQAGRPVSVLHVLCHGAETGGDASAGPAFGLGLHADEERGSAPPVVLDAGALRRLLSPHADTLRLVVLCACDSAHSGPLASQLGSVAQAVHRAGIQAVIASRYPLSTLGSVHLAEVLYDTLLVAPDSLENAFRAARRRLAATQHGIDWASVILFARAEDGDDTRPISVPPYRGLLTFQPQHSRFFFGREAECARALRSLQQLRNTGRPRCLLVTGASGTGKSSVVLAGLLPALTSDADDPSASDSAAFRAVTTAADDRQRAREAVEQLWQLLSHYGHRPTLQQALSAMAGELESLPWVGSTGWDCAVIRPGRDPLAVLQAAVAGRNSPERPFLLVVDQLEETFADAITPTVRQAFVARIWQLCQGDSGISSIITLRVDLLGRCGDVILDGAGLRLDRVAYDDAHRVFVAQMQPSALRTAVVAPAHRVGIQLEDALVHRILADVEGEPGALPLLEHVLDLLWQRRTGSTLTAQSYAELGGVSGALERTAEQAFAGLSDEDRGLARRLFAALMSIPEEGGEIARRRAGLSELYALAVGDTGTGAAGQPAARRAQMDSVIDAFVAVRLLIRGTEGPSATEGPGDGAAAPARESAGGEPYVEVAHEALLRKWPRLRTWLREDQKRLGEIQELDRWARQWVRYGTPLRGSQLGYAANVLQKYRADLSPAIRDMIATSQRAARRRATIAAISIICIVTTLTSLAAVAYRQKRRAQGQAAVALSRLLSDQAMRQQGQNSDVALLLAAHAVQLNDEPESRAALLAATESTRPLRAFLRGPTGRVATVAFSPDGRMLAAAGSDDAVWLFDPGTAQPLGTLRSATRTGAAGEGGDQNHALAFRPDGRLLAAGRSDGRIALWDPQTRAPAGPPLGSDARAIYSLDFSADRQTLAAGGDDGRIWMWDMAQRAPRRAALTGHTQAIASLQFSRGDARLLASGSGDSSARLWDVTTGQPRGSALAGHQEYVSSVALSPDGTLLATASADRTLQLWDTATGTRRGEPLSQHTDGVSGVAFLPSGRVLVSCGLDQQVLLWDPRSGERQGRPLRLPVGPILSCALSPDGRLLAAAGEGVIALVDLTGHAALRRQDERYRQPVAALGLSPDGQLLAVGDAEGRLRFWDVRHEQPLGEALPMHRGAINGLSFSPDGKTVVSGGSDHAVSLIDVQSHSRVGILPATHSAAVTAVAYAPHGDFIVTSSADSVVALWDARSRQLRVPPVATHQMSATAVAIRPDGQELAVGGLDGSIQLLDPQSGRGRCPSLAGHSDAVTALAYSPDGRLLASGARDQTARLWHIDGCPGGGGDVLRRHSAAVTSLAFRSDGKVLATGGQDAAIWLWDLPLRQPPTQPLREPLRPINALAFSTGGLLLAGDDELIWPWHTTPDVQLSCSRANRNFSRAEWRRYLGDVPYCRVCAALPSDDGTPAPACAQ